MRSSHLEVVFIASLALGATGCQTTRIENPPAIHAAAEQFPLGKLTIDLPSFRTLEELKVWGKPRDETEKFYLFEKGESKVGIVVATQGSGDRWNVVFVYEYDSLRNLWAPVALWDTAVRGVRASFDKRSGMIDVRSGGGVLIVRANISALVAKRTREW